jgi:crossover junction endodeoxyribonuclease RusA
VTRHLSEADPTRWLIDVPLVIAGKRGNAPLTANARLHWRRRAEYVKTIREVVAARARHIYRIPPQDHITVGLHYAPGDHLRRDASNLMATQKAAVDGLVGIVVPDDTARYVTERMPTIRHPGPTDFTRRLVLCR